MIAAALSRGAKSFIHTTKHGKETMAQKKIYWKLFGWKSNISYLCTRFPRNRWQDVT